MLPQSTEAISDEQKALIEEALKKGSQQTILMSHFTYANYSLNIALNDEGAINVGDDDSLGIFDYGTFNKNRQYVFDQIIDNKINLTLSGHSHRAALYQKEKVTDTWQFFSFKRRTDKLIVNTVPLQAQQYKNVDSKQSAMLVSACGGPIAVQNHYGELLGCGLDYPSGSYIKPDQTGLYTAKTQTAQPRFAVALDFMDIVGKDKHINRTGVFKQFHSSQEKPFEFIIELNNTPCNVGDDSKRVLPAVDFIKGIRFYAYQYKGVMPELFKIDCQLQYVEDYKYKMEIDEDDIDNISSEISNKRGYDLYMEITFNNRLASHEGYKQYNYDSSWFIPILLTENRVSYHDHGRNMRHRQEGYKIIRHPVVGEVPDFEDRELYFNEKYTTSA